MTGIFPGKKTPAGPNLFLVSSKSRTPKSHTIIEARRAFLGEKPENGEKEESPSSRKRGHGVMAADVSGNPPKKGKVKRGKKPNPHTIREKKG